MRQRTIDFKMPLIKKLSPEELAEGLTPEFVNSVNMHKCCSPVQFRKAGPVQDLLVATSGYVVFLGVSNGVSNKNVPQIFEESPGKPVIFERRVCHIARARYLKNFDERDKLRKVREWIDSCVAEITEQVNTLEQAVQKNENIIVSAVTQRLQGVFHNQWTADRASAEQERLLPKHQIAQTMWEARQLVPLAEFLSLHFKMPFFAVMRTKAANAPFKTLEEYAWAIVEKEHAAYYHNTTTP